MHNSYRIAPSYILMSLLIFLAGCVSHKEQPLELHTIYGTVQVHEPIIKELLASDAMQRLKRINQHGIHDVIKPAWAFSRYDHSVGVFALTRMYGGSLEEQVAALLHDVSHTVFSHVGDLVFADASHTEGSTAYQDDIHVWFVEHTDLAPILTRYNMLDVVSDEAKHTFKRLEQEYPDLCADRIDYQLRTAYIVGLLTLSDVHAILEHMHFQDDRWFFDDVAYARQFALASVWLTRNIYASACNAYTYKIAADAFKRAMEINLISADELHFSFDDVIWQRIQQSQDPMLQRFVACIEHHETAYKLVDATSAYDYHRTAKCRVSNPFVHVGESVVRLAEIDDTFAQAYAAIQQFCKEGVYLAFHNVA